MDPIYLVLYIIYLFIAGWFCTRRLFKITIGWQETNLSMALEMMCCGLWIITLPAAFLFVGIVKLFPNFAAKHLSISIGTKDDK